MACAWACSTLLPCSTPCAATVSLAAPTSLTVSPRAPARRSAGSYAHSHPARFWDPTLNTALCEMPPQCVNYSDCRGKYPFFAAPVPGLRPFIDAGELVSVSDGAESHRLTARGRGGAQRACQGRGDQRRLVRYELVRQTTAHGECLAHQLVFDPDGFFTNDAARRTGSSRSMLSGCYRVMCPNTGLLTEGVAFHRVKFDSFTDEPCVLRHQGGIHSAADAYLAVAEARQVDSEARCGCPLAGEPPHESSCVDA